MDPGNDDYSTDEADSNEDGDEVDTNTITILRPETTIKEVEDRVPKKRQYF